MQFPKRAIDRTTIEHANGHARDHVSWVIRLASNFLKDPKRKDRKRESKCMPCFYRESRIGGASITTQPCGICGKERVFPSTATDALCLECAIENGLCCECGGDMEMANRRKPRPFETKEDTP